MDPVAMFERAGSRAASLARTVRADQRELATPCSEWDVAALLEHMANGAAYLLGAVGADVSLSSRWPDASVVDGCVAALRVSGALERMCMSPAGFEWPVAQAAAGTAMDQLIHTWDLAVAIGQDREMDAELTDLVIGMFLPQMPEIGRQAGFIGPEVPVPADAPAADRLLCAMGRNPAR